MPRQNFFIDLLVECLDLDVPLLPYENPFKFVNRKRKQKQEEEIKRKQYQQSIWKLQRRGFLKIVEKNNQRFIKVTGEGQLEILLRTSKTTRPQKWDGKWRVLIFDIPESARKKRDTFRFLLKQNNFVKLQASVFVSPYPLNREAVLYLKQAGLINYIRILRVDEMDDDKNLRKRFDL